MIKARTCFHILFVALFFIGLTMTAAFAAPDKSLIEEAVTLVMDNYIDEPDNSFIVKQTLEGALLKLRESKKTEPASTNTPADATKDKKAAVNLIKEGLGILSDKFGIPYRELEYAALKNLAVSLDPHSDFLTPHEMQELSSATKGVFAGVGMEVNIKDNVLTVVSPIDDSPALAAGIAAGDQILQINDKHTKDLTITQAVNLIRGEAGSIVRILVMRSSFDKPREFNIRRALITVKSVKYRELEEGIGYLRMASFQGNTADEVEKALNALGSRQNKIKGLVIDLRNNPGGLLDQTISVADKFIDNDLIVSIKGRTAKSENKFSGKTLGTHFPFSIIILINRGSASAAEIFAGSLHSYGKAMLAGEKTFGKGTVQTIYDLSDGSGLKLTTSRYYLPSGMPVGQGINPDIVLAEKEGEDYPLAVAQGVFQKMIRSGRTAAIDQLISLARETVQAPASVTQVAARQTNSTAALIERPSFTAAEGIWTADDLAVIIGVEKYQDLPAAEYAAKDARLVKDYLRSLGLKERNVELLLNERGTLSSIKKTLESWLPNRIKKNSRVLVYYSGHGAPDASSGDAYLVPYDGDPNYLSDTGYPLKRLYEKLGRLAAKEVIVLLDSCFSGAGGRSVLAKGARPLVMTAETPVVGANMVILSAAEGSQISTSSTDKGHGLFTYYVLKALQDGKKSISDIYEFIRPQVEDDAKALNVRQTPQIVPKGERLHQKFYLRN